MPTSILLPSGRKETARAWEGAAVIRNNRLCARQEDRQPRMRRKQKKNKQTKEKREKRKSVHFLPPREMRVEEPSSIFLLFLLPPSSDAGRS
jgi:hypothetical protein